jgi:hypothetical protein
VVKPGNRHTSNSKDSEPHLWSLLEPLPRTHWPSLARGDKNWGTQRNMARCEQEGLPYLFKLRLTRGVRQTIEKMIGRDGWVDAGQGWTGHETQLCLKGWSRSRRIIMLRRRLPETLAVTVAGADAQGDLFWTDTTPGAAIWEFAALVTSLDMEIRSLAQLYRDRGDSENPFDELKNQWGWAGFTTADINRCQLMARLIALIYNWWSLYSRLADPNQHHEALTTRSLLLNAVARQTRHAGQTRLTVTSSHGRRRQVKVALQRVSKFLSEWTKNAEQLTDAERWTYILVMPCESVFAGENCSRRRHYCRRKAVGEIPSRSKTCCWNGVGVARMVAHRSLPKRTVLRVTVARSLSSVRKLCTGWPASVRLVAALRAAAGETLALLTGELRWASAAARS